jgi:hypothetical protein
MAKATSIHHLRQHAERHHEAHLRLKELLRYAPDSEGLIKTVAYTAAVILLGAAIFMGGKKVYEVLTTPTPQIEWQTSAYKTGMNAALRIHEQARRITDNIVRTLPTAGTLKGIDAALAMGRTPESTLIQQALLETSLWFSNTLGKGQYMTKLLQSNARSLQKSILASYLFGEKTVEITSALDMDTKILQRMQNALSLDLFQYLNQSVVRADALDDYLKLLTLLQETAENRIRELQSKIGFLQGSYASVDARTQTKEEAFFENLKNLQGAEAEKALREFVGVQNNQVETRAKIGAYQKVQEYYKFFLPRLERLAYEIRLNREPLIAGVKVVEIQRMQLPLIVPEP